MIIVECEQGSAEWMAARLGLVTASCLADVCAKSRDKKTEGATRANYRAKLVCERLTGVSCDKGYSSKAMDDGKELEPLARAAYEIRNGVMVDQYGLILHSSIPNFAASPDGCVGDDGGVEIKCGYPKTHFEWLKAGKVPAEHVKQMLGNLSCTGRSWWDFVSFCPNFPERWQLFVVRLWREVGAISEIEKEVIQFDSEVVADIAALEALPADLGFTQDENKDAI